MTNPFEEEPALILITTLLVPVVIYACIGWWILAIPVVVALVWAAWWAARQFIESRRTLDDELDRIAWERNRAAANLVALRQQAVREMVDIAREDIIDGTAREVDRR